jgi:hypothetical protein
MNALHSALSYRGDVVWELLRIVGKQEAKAVSRPITVWVLVLLASITQYNNQVGRAGGVASGVRSWASRTVCLRAVAVASSQRVERVAELPARDHRCVFLSRMYLPPHGLQAVALWKRKVASGHLSEEATSQAIVSCALAMQTHFESIMRTAEVSASHKSGPVIGSATRTAFSHVLRAACSCSCAVQRRLQSPWADACTASCSATSPPCSIGKRCGGAAVWSGMGVPVAEMACSCGGSLHFSVSIRGMYDTWISGSDVHTFCCYGFVYLLDSW